MGWFGNQDTGGASSYIDTGGTAKYAQFTTDGTVSGQNAVSMSWYLNATTTGDMKVALYSDSSNLPNNLLANGQATFGVISLNWFTVTFNTPYALANNTTYWFGAEASTTSTTLAYYGTTTGQNSFKDDTNSYAAMPVNPWSGSHTDYTVRLWHVYVTYQASGEQTVIGRLLLTNHY
jgi:hypothetical protein